MMILMKRLLLPFVGACFFVQRNSAFVATTQTCLNNHRSPKKGSAVGDSAAFHRSVAFVVFSRAEDGEENDSTGSSFEGFNPLNYNAASAAASSLHSSFKKTGSSSKNVISLRKTRMQQITNEMLNAVPDDTQLAMILQENKEFLLEPLEDDNAVQDEDSIYLDCSSRRERYRAFDQSMTERLESARNPSVRQVLTAMKEFVLKCEDE